MNDALTLDDLWRRAPRASGAFDPGTTGALPVPVQRYLRHAIAPATPLATAVRLRTRGEIRLKGWCPFRAEQVILRDGSMIWQATVRLRGVPIKGSDRFVGGAGALDWRVLGLFPVMRASGPDVSRSAAGRVAAETIWLPSVLAGADVNWSKAGPGGLVSASFSRQGFPMALTIALDGDGAVERVSMERWGNPDGGAFREVVFGALVEAERTFGGYTIPSRLRVGWYIGTPRFESEGEFFRCTIEEAVFRAP